jgi:hypothetical protein
MSTETPFAWSSALGAIAAPAAADTAAIPFRNVLRSTVLIASGERGIWVSGAPLPCQECTYWDE